LRAAHGERMICLIEALDYRCLRYIRQPLDRFGVLVGPNASGKTTFLDVVAFLSDLVSEGLEEAVGKRTANVRDLLWQHAGDRFELAVEAAVPEALQERMADRKYDTVRYEVAIGIDPATEEVQILGEQAQLKGRPQPQQKTLFPEEPAVPPTILVPSRRSNTKTLVHKMPGGNDNFYSEVHPKQGRWAPAFKLGPRKSALANLPEDETAFPTATYLKALLSQGVQKFVLNSLVIRRASPPGQARGFKTDGSNLPWVAHRLGEDAPERFGDWVSHLQTALPDLAGIRTVERPDDRHRYLVLQYRGGLEIPSWVASDGTLRLLALTLPAYLPNSEGVYLIEEPENGVHPRAVQAVHDSLSSVYDGQVLLATHSPVLLSVSEPRNVLCFARTQTGATDIVRGDLHPRLSEWRGEPNLSVLFASGVLG
jgi:predicted ATPase